MADERDEGPTLTAPPHPSDWDLLVEVRSFRLAFTEEAAWTAPFVAALREWGFALEGGVLSVEHVERDANGTLVRGPTKLSRVGSHRFFAPDELALPQGQKPLECPFLRAPLGVLAVRLDPSVDRTVVRELVGGLMKEGMGRVVATARAHPAVEPLEVHCTAKRPFSLLLHKYSFDDGDVLLSRTDEAYVDYVIAEVKAALRANGLEGDLGAAPTCHNPFRYWEEENRFAIYAADGSPPSQAELEGRLGALMVEIWVYDFEGAESLVDATVLG